jgi:hypothetical protein
MLLLRKHADGLPRRLRFEYALRQNAGDGHLLRVDLGGGAEFRRKLFDTRQIRQQDAARMFLGDRAAILVGAVVILDARQICIYQFFSAVIV